MVLAGRLRDETVWQELDQFIRVTPIEAVAPTRELAEIGHLAFIRFGKGRALARLNLRRLRLLRAAKSRNIPLLFQGSDFARTDIVPALPAPA